MIKKIPPLSLHINHCFVWCEIRPVVSWGSSILCKQGQGSQNIELKLSTYTKKWCSVNFTIKKKLIIQVDSLHVHHTQNTCYNFLLLINNDNQCCSLYTALCLNPPPAINSGNLQCEPCYTSSFL